MTAWAKSLWKRPALWVGWMSAGWLSVAHQPSVVALSTAGFGSFALGLACHAAWTHNRALEDPQQYAGAGSCTSRHPA